MTKESNKFINIIVIALSVFTISVLTVVYFFLKPQGPKKVYSESLSSVVELKASSEGFGESFGTAVFVKEDGTLITNAHVVLYKQAGGVHTFENYEIRFATENNYRKTELIKYDEKEDLAVLKISETCSFKSVKFGNSDEIKAGDTVYAIGNALNFGISITQGIVSIPFINIEYENNVKRAIQCDLIINEGNSGGALFNEEGRLIGITTFRTRNNFGSIVYGIAYSIPVNIVNSFICG